jgi:hypothetical protein
MLDMAKQHGPDRGLTSPSGGVGTEPAYHAADRPGAEEDPPRLARQRLEVVEPRTLPSIILWRFIY